MENKQYDVVIKLVKNQKPCNMDHKIGDEWEFSRRTPEGMRSLAYNAIFPFVMVMKYGGRFQWQTDPDVITASCPDSEVVNAFEIRRKPSK